MISNNLKEDELVLLSKSDLPPLKWPLARIVKIHPGRDGLVRVVDLLTTKGIVTRSVTQVCLLPLAFEPIAQPGEHVSV